MLAVGARARGTSLEVVAATAEDMRHLGAALAGVLRPGDTVLLGGDLGAGKTTLVQGLAAALGVTEAVTSPTFVLVHAYRSAAGWDLLHADVWRLEQLREVVDLAIPEQLEEGAAVIVEWGERAGPALAQDCLQVVIDFAGEGGPNEPGASAAGPRRVVLSAPGPRWSQRLGDVLSALGGAARPC
ncbi:MAG TPA: tRNA (adenosine(37)-N6)-threonylcarbamoyltransferase complex ATPase subunit type 1 TsaE [Acidimicrobiales bacterium]|nr:tRNA (adenosine(37)-N6)-threonylcarbamoyltransferase complex ATPase subunit type 1 TsaE [Acidimicrobiales bacterium]